MNGVANIRAEIAEIERRRRPVMMPDAKFYLARRDTRWDVYPGREQIEAVAHDWYGFWSFDAANGFWWKTPTSYVLENEITKSEAEAFAV